MHPQVQCDTVGQDPVTYQGTMGAFKYAVKQLKDDAHGALLTSNDTPDAVTFRRIQHAAGEEGRGEARRGGVVVEP